MIRVHVRVSEIIGALIDADAEKKTCVLSLISILSMSTFTFEKNVQISPTTVRIFILHIYVAGTSFCSYPTYIFQIQTKWCMYVCMCAASTCVRA